MAFLIWSNQKGMWWRPNERGYTPIIDEAGRYDRDAAEKIVSRATLDGMLTHRCVDPVTGVERSICDEVMVLAPESIGGES